jgi:hypothetical protein
MDLTISSTAVLVYASGLRIAIFMKLSQLLHSTPELKRFGA